MSTAPSILLFDRDPLFREGIRNYLLSAGFQEVDVARSVGEVIERLRRSPFGRILIGTGHLVWRDRRLARLAKYRQPRARVILLVNSADQPQLVDTDQLQVVIKEFVYSNLLELL